MAKPFDKPAAKPEGVLDTPGSALSDPQQGHQSRHATEGEPKPVPLSPAKDESGKPVDAPPTPPTADGQPVPRFLHQNERAPEGLVRFKIRAVDYHPQPTRYVLARDEAEARTHYLLATGLQAVIDSFPEKDRAEPRMSVRRMAD